MSSLKLTRRDRLAAWIVTGPIGRVVAFALDLAVAWSRWLRGRVNRRK